MWLKMALTATTKEEKCVWLRVAGVGLGPGGCVRLGWSFLRWTPLSLVGGPLSGSEGLELENDLLTSMGDNPNFLLPFWLPRRL